MTRRPRTVTCFLEADPTLSLARRSLTEAMGTLLLMFFAIASGFRVHDAARFGSLAGAVAVPATLVGLVLAFGAVSGGHFNPWITVLQWLRGERTSQCTLAYVASQLIGSVTSARLAAATCGVPGKVLHSARGQLKKRAITYVDMARFLSCPRKGRDRSLTLRTAGRGAT